MDIVRQDVGTGRRDWRTFHLLHDKKFGDGGAVRGARILEARGGIEPPIMVLQTIALPLGDRAAGQSRNARQFSVIGSK
jgi:hypothetical protein